MSNHDQPPMVVPPPSYPTMPPSPPPPLDYYCEEAQGKNLREYFHILLKRKWWVIGTFLTIFLLVALYAFLRTPIYRPTATLQITQDNQNAQLQVENSLSKLTGSSDTDKFLQTQYKILHSKSLALRVINDLNLKEHPDFKSIKEDSPKKSENAIENIMIKKFLRKLDVSPIKNTYLVNVSYQSHDKVMAQRVVNAIAGEYMNLSIDRRNQSFELVRKWLNKQLEEMAEKVQSAQKKLYKFGQKTNIYTMNDKDNVIVQKYIDLSALLTKAQAEKMAKEAQYKQIKDKGPNAPLIVNNPLVAALRQQEVTEEAKVSAMRKVFRAGHPDLQAELANLAEVKGRLNGEVRRIEESVKADYEAANRTEQLLSDSFTAQKAQMAKLQDNLINYQILQRDAQTNEQFYQALLARVKEANIAGTMVPSTVAIIDPARIPNAPYKPNVLLDLVLAVVSGLILGVVLAFLVEHVDDSIKSLDDLERACSLPSLGILPLISSTNGKGAISSKKIAEALGMTRYLPKIQRSRPTEVDAADMDLIVYKHPKSQMSEALQHVYSSIMLSVSGKPPCAIMITSPNPAEGKSTVASNLALSCASNDRPVVLIDCDLRKPRLHYAFKVASQPGLANHLTGSASLEEILRPSSIPNLTIITAGPTPPSPTNLLNSDMFQEMLKELRQRFRHIILDTPPILGFADARFISPLVDGVLLVAKYQSTHKSAGRLAQQLLNQAPVLGTVLNSVGVHGQTYGGHYYYHNYYKYYSKYYDNKEN